MKRRIYLLSAIVLLTGLGGLAYLTARFFSDPDRQQSSVQFNSSPTLVKARQLPPGDPDVVGVFVRRQDNSLFVGTGQIVFDRKRDPISGNASFTSAYDGPVVEILVTHDTQVFLDVTPLPASQTRSSSIQQVVQASDPDRLGKTAVISAWGSTRSGRLLARTILILPPPG